MSQDSISLSDFSFCLSSSSSAVKIQPIHHLSCQSYRLYLKEEGWCTWEDSGQVVSKSTFKNVSCFIFVAFGLPQYCFQQWENAVWIKSTQLKEEGLAICATATDGPPLVFLYSKVWRCLLLCMHSFVLLTGRSCRENWSFRLSFMLSADDNDFNELLRKLVVFSSHK